MYEHESKLIQWCGTGCVYADQKVRLAFSNDGADWMYACKKLNRLLAFENILREVGCGSFTKELPPSEGEVSVVTCPIITNPPHAQDTLSEPKSFEANNTNLVIPVPATFAKPEDPKEITMVITESGQVTVQPQKIVATQSITGSTSVKPPVTEPNQQIGPVVVGELMKKKRGRPPKKNLDTGQSPVTQSSIL